MTKLFSVSETLTQIFFNSKIIRTPQVTFPWDALVTAIWSVMQEMSLPLTYFGFPFLYTATRWRNVLA